jgi:hypothetical protein
MEQNYKNHARLLTVWHYITPLIWLVLLAGAVYNLIRSMHATRLQHDTAALIVAIIMFLAIFYWYSRAFALRAQDRAIRAEENFRYYILTGKPLHPELRMSQIIALRFAPDDELPSLAERAVRENLSSKDIKQAIKNWKADHHRV